MLARTGAAWWPVIALGVGAAAAFTIRREGLAMVPAALAAGLAVIKEAAAEAAPEQASAAPKEMMEACVLLALISGPWRAVALMQDSDRSAGVGGMPRTACAGDAPRGAPHGGVWTDMVVHAIVGAG